MVNDLFFPTKHYRLVLINGKPEKVYFIKHTGYRPNEFENWLNASYQPMSERYGRYKTRVPQSVILYKSTVKSWGEDLPRYVFWGDYIKEWAIPRLYDTDDFDLPTIGKYEKIGNKFVLNH